MVDVLLDTNVIIDLIDLDCFERILDSAALRFCVVENVKAEITQSTQRQRLEQQLRQGRIRETRVASCEEQQTYTELRRVLADGEAASLAVACHRGWAFATYEKGRTEREALRLLGPGRFLRTPELMAVVIREGVVNAGMLSNHLRFLLNALNANLDEKELRRVMHLVTLHKEVQGTLSGSGGERI